MILVDAFPNLPDIAGQTNLTSPPDGSDRLFVTTRAGLIYVFPNDPNVSSATLFADLSGVVRTDNQERGLLGLAFDPDFATNRRFYVNYTSDQPICGVSGNDGCTQIASYEASAANPNQADLSTRQLILEFAQPGANHNAGMLAFGPDGMLYSSSGDGGGNGAENNSQDRSNLLGTLIRLDVRDGAPSLIPSDNPFVGVAGVREEIFAYGLRNPWRFSFDRVTGDIFIGDVGEQTREEISFLDAASSGGENFGWPICEGFADWFGDCASSGTTLPVLDYPHNGSSASVAGGYVYRGTDLPELIGAYIYNDSFTGVVQAWDRVPGSPPVQIASDSSFIVSWGEASDGELFALSLNGGIQSLQRNGPPSGNVDTFPELLSETGLFADTPNLVPATGLIPYEVTAPLWSDNAEKLRWIGLPAGRKIGFKANGEWDFPLGTVVIKQFNLNQTQAPFGSRRVETRVFVRQLDDWAGVTYRWNAAQTEANLMSDGLTENVDLGNGQSQDWKYPSPAECLGCHSTAAGRVLGTRTDQLSGILDYSGILQAQLEAWDCGGLFDHSIGDLSRYSMKSARDDTTQTSTHRIRSSVDTNCGVCHQPGGAGRGAMDLRFETAVGDWNAVGVQPEFGDLGVPAAGLIAPGDALGSVFWRRQVVTDIGVRMARGTLLPDGDAISDVSFWIESDLDFIDSDEDGIEDATDVCPMVPDPAQADGDFDGIGDLCDPDSLPRLRSVGNLLPTSGYPGQTALQLIGSVENQGPSVSESFPVTFYLSENAVFEPEFDFAVGSCWVSPLGPGGLGGCFSLDGGVPADILEAGETSKTLNWVVCANRSGVAPEADAASACDVPGDTLEIPVPEPGFGLGLGSVFLVLLALGRDDRRLRDSGSD